MSEKKIKKKMGRPLKEFDQKQFEGLCKIQCTQEEICDLFDCDHKTLNRWCRSTYGGTFSHAYKKLSHTGKISLRRAMFRKAVEGGNTTMQIWLSKQYLGMTDKIVDDSAGYDYSEPEFLAYDKKTS